MTYIVFFGLTDDENNHGANSINVTCDNYDDVWTHIRSLRQQVSTNTFIHVHHVESKTSWDMTHGYIDQYIVIDEDKPIHKQNSYPNLGSAMYRELKDLKELKVADKNTGDVYLVKRY